MRAHRCLHSSWLSIVALISAAPVTAQWSLTGRGYDYDDEVDFRQTQLELSYLRSRGTWRLRHDYRVFELPAIAGEPPASNGHVHALALGWQSGWGAWDIGLAPVLAVSSNVLKHPDTMRASDWQLHAHALRWLDGPGAGYWNLGLRADSRFGRYLPYPVAQWHWSGEHGFAIAIGLPDNTATWTLHRHWRLNLEVGPGGGYWQVRDENLDQVSHLQQQRWQSGLYLGWRPSRRIDLTLGATWFWQEEWRYRLADGQRTKEDIPDHAALTLTLGLNLPP